LTRLTVNKNEHEYLHAHAAIKEQQSNQPTETLT